MNKISKYIIICLCTLGLTSCNKWLSDTSGDLLIPRTVTEFIPILYGEGYPRSFNADGAWIALMTDDIEMGHLERAVAQLGAPGFDASSGGEGRRAFRWDADIEEGLIDNFWPQRYRNILGCNTIISQLPHMTYSEAQVGLYHSLAARAYTLRAYNYFCLVNVYARPWSTQNLNMPGVPLRKSPEISGDPLPRSTIGDVYKFIEEDLALAEYHMAKAEVSANKHFIGQQALLLLKTRVALFQEKWDDVIRIGEEFLKNNPAIRNLNALREDELGLTGATFPFMFDLAGNPEIVFTFGNASTSYNNLSDIAYYEFGFKVSRPVDPGHPNYPAPNVPLMSLYEENEYFDLRRLAYFRRDERDAIGNLTRFQYYYPMKYKSASNGYRENWRTVEVYLNVAEAYARRATGVSEEAIELVNALRANRIRTETFIVKTVSNFANKEALVQFIWDERRRELCFEEHHRWWDLRRQGMQELEHREFISTTEYEVYILPEGSPNWVLEIPRSESLINDRIVGNNRVQINPR